MQYVTADGQHIDEPLAANELLREDGKRIERLCKHGVGHPIGAVGTWELWMGVHGCDGCCFKAEFWLKGDGSVANG